MIDGKPETVRHDADDRVRDPAEIDGAAHDLRVAGESQLPRLIADDDDRQGGVPFVGREQVAAGERRGPRHGKSRGGDLRNPDWLRRRLA